MGIYISIATRSQLLASQMAILTSFLPTFLLSGFTYEIFNMPKVVQAFTYFIPARYFITLVRGIMLKGVGPDVLWPYGLGMIAYGAVGLLLAVRAFRKEIA